MKEYDAIIMMCQTCERVTAELSRFEEKHRTFEREMERLDKLSQSFQRDIDEAHKENIHMLDELGY